jgi:hypothetical protein
MGWGWREIASVISVLMGITNAGRQKRSCMATLLYCDRGACGPDGAG